MIPASLSCSALGMSSSISLIAKLNKVHRSQCRPIHLDMEKEVANHFHRFFQAFSHQTFSTLFKLLSGAIQKWQLKNYYVNYTNLLF